MSDSKNFENVKTPIFAAVGAGDAVVQAVADVVAQVRSRAESRTSEVNARIADISEDVTEGVESLRERLANLPAELPDEIAELRERFTPEELRKVAEAYLKVASDLYTSLAERGEMHGHALRLLAEQEHIDEWTDFTVGAVYGVPDDQAGDQAMAGLVLRDGVTFDPAGFATWIDAQADIGPKWRPRYVRVMAEPPTTPFSVDAMSSELTPSWRALSCSTSTFTTRAGSFQS